MFYGVMSHDSETARKSLNILRMLARSSKTKDVESDGRNIRTFMEKRRSENDERFFELLETLDPRTYSQVLEVLIIHQNVSDEHLNELVVGGQGLEATLTRWRAIAKAVRATQGSTL